MWKRWVSLSLLGIVIGCEPTEVLALQPKPNVSFPKQPPNIALQLAPAIRDTYALPEHDGIETVSVHAWRGTLNNAFRNGFQSREPSAETVTLVLERAELTFVPAVLSAQGVVGIRAQIRYRGRWVGRDGELPFSGTAESKLSTPKQRELEGISASAVESMYEAIWGAVTASH